MDDHKEIAEVCERAARAGGAVLLDWSERFTVREKGPADLVTEADLAAENVVRRTIKEAFPNDRFIGEESTPSEQVEEILNDPSSCVWWSIRSMEQPITHITFRTTHARSRRFAAVRY